MVYDKPGTGRGEWKRFCDDDCRRKAQTEQKGTVIRRLRPGEAVPDGEPRRYQSQQGYIQLRWRVAPKLLVETYEHRVRDGFVVDAEHVHHRNHDPADNRPVNLQPMTALEHAELHADDRRAPWHAIARMYEDGLTQPQIAERLGCNNATVSRALKRVGVKARPTRARYPLPSEPVVRSAYASVHSAPELAKALGIAVNTARVALRTYGLPPFPPGRPSTKRG